MTTDEMVSLASRIAGRLVGIMESEWSRWAKYAELMGLREAIRFAETVAKSPSVPPGRQQSYRMIREVIPTFYPILEALETAELNVLFGFVRREIEARRESVTDKRPGVVCGSCGFEIVDKDDAIVHTHVPDFFLNVYNCQAHLARSTARGAETLDFEMPDHWVDFILESSGGSINVSGIYRLPGLMWEWVLLKCLQDERGAAFVAQRIDNWLASLGRGNRQEERR
jgi:hypothetical protein